MKKTIITLFAAALVLPAVADDKGFEKIFDGKTLKGWDGNPKFWSVKDGAITGQTTKENPTQGNTFIIWKAGTTKNFILELEFKINGGNSGIQYRSFKKGGKNDGWRIGGYQADFEAGDRYSGICYGEGFRGILSDRGFKTTLTVDDKGKLQKKAEKFGDSKEIGKAKGSAANWCWRGCSNSRRGERRAVCCWETPTGTSASALLRPPCYVCPVCLPSIFRRCC